MPGPTPNTYRRVEKPKKASDKPKKSFFEGSGTFLGGLVVILIIRGIIALVGNIGDDSPSRNVYVPQRESSQISEPYDGELDCSDISGTTSVPASDPYDLDRDGDGIGCEPFER